MFSWCPRPKEILNSSFQKVVRSKQLRYLWHNNLMSVRKRSTQTRGKYCLFLSWLAHGMCSPLEHHTASQTLASDRTSFSSSPLPHWFSYDTRFLSHVQSNVGTMKYVELIVVSVSDRVEIFFTCPSHFKYPTMHLHVSCIALGEYKSRGFLPFLVSIHVHSQNCVCFLFILKIEPLIFWRFAILQALFWNFACVALYRFHNTTRK